MPKLKILFIVKSFSAPGGAERVLAHIAQGLAERGHDITVASFDPPGAEPFYATGPDVRLIHRQVGDPAAPTSPLEMARRMFAIRRLLATERPDVAVGFMSSSYVPLAAAAVGTGIPTIGSEHIVYSHYSDRLIERTLIRIAAPMLNSIVAISEPMRRSFPAHLRRTMGVIPNPVAVASTSVDVVGGDKKILLAIGRLEPQKNHAVLICAFADVAERYPDWTIRIVGQGELRPSLEAQVARLGMNDRVEFAGVIQDIAGEFARAQLFAMPSRYESFGLAAAEALAHGLPVIGFADCPGTNEIINDGVNGLLVSGTDRVTALAEGLCRLMESDELRRCLGNAGPASVARFSTDAIVSQWEDLLYTASGKGRAKLEIAGNE